MIVIVCLEGGEGGGRREEGGCSATLPNLPSLSMQTRSSFQKATVTRNPHQLSGFQLVQVHQAWRHGEKIDLEIVSSMALKIPHHTSFATDYYCNTSHEA